MPTKKKVKTGDTHLVWRDEEVETLLETTRDFRVSKAYEGVVLQCSTTHDSWINYRNKLKLCRKTYKNDATRTLCFCWTKDQKLLLHVNVSPHDVEFSGVFVKVINMCIVTESLVFIVLQLIIGKYLCRRLI